MAELLRILIVDDQKLMRQGLRVLLELEADMVVVGEAGDGRAALERYADLRPDVVLMDVRMPEMDGVAATREIHGRWPEARVIILTTFDDDALVFDGIRAGARGYMLKDLSGDELARAIRTVAAGGSLLDPAVTGKVLDAFTALSSGGAPTPTRPPVEPLTEREVEILRLIAAGHRNPAIARRLHLAEGTVKNYVSSILQKTGAGDRTQAVLAGQRLGLLDP